MDLKETMKALEAAGSAQTRKTYGRHGVSEPMFGVSAAALGKLKKAIKTDHALAVELWETGNHDARVLATMIGDPAAATLKELDSWLKGCGDPVITAAFSGFAASSPHAVKRFARWIAMKGEWPSTAGWSVVAGLALEPDVLGDEELVGLLERIEAGIHAAPNRTRYAMNQALISIGCRPSMTERAIAAARKIGKVEVDHGPTSCKTPDAEAYIKKTLAHYRAKGEQAKKAGKKVVTGPRRKQSC